MRYGVDLRGPCVMLLSESQGGSTQNLAQMYRALNNLILSERWQVIVGQFAGEMVLLAQNSADIPVIAQRALERLVPRPRADFSVRIGISSVVHGVKHIKRAYQQCHDVLYITRRLHQDKRIARFDDLGYLHALFQAGPAGLVGNSYVPLVRRLAEEKQADLLHTLEAYLDSGGNGVATAEALHIHRSTLNYRLTRIEQVCEVELQNPGVRMDLQIALKLLRLFEDVGM
jgi:PucR family transcriptional regulator, purine catabolism regulatory protein